MTRMLLLLGWLVAACHASAQLAFDALHKQVVACAGQTNAVKHHSMSWRSIFVAVMFAGVCLTGVAQTIKDARNGLAWDATLKEIAVPLGATNVTVGFHVTNISTAPIVINNVTATCGCSLVQVPAKPWTLAAGDSGEIKMVTDLRGKRGVLIKSVIVYSSVGIRVATAKVNIPEPARVDSRSLNLQAAQADRQAVFKGDCAKCHAEPAKGKQGKELFAAACAICHEASPRASMVPDLKALRKPTQADYWRQWITHGKVGTLMPGFSDKHGGPLTEGQVESLVEFLAAGGSQPAIKQKP